MKVEYVTLVEWYWHKRTKALGAILSWCRCVHHKSYMHWPGT